MPEWVEHAVWWQIYPLGFLGADTAARSPGPGAPAAAAGGVAGARGRLGLSGLALGPIFASATHGYDTIDHLRIDPRLGDDQDFDHLVAAAHDRGLRVLLDGVFNHVGRDFPVFRRAVEQGPGSPEAAWFQPDGDDYRTFEGHHGLVTLNHADPVVADHVADVMTHWLDRGADGWRLDAAYAVPTEFWATVLPR